MEKRTGKQFRPFQLVLDEQALQAKVAEVAVCTDVAKLAHLAAELSATQRLQLISRLLSEQKLEQALSLICLIPTQSRRLREMKLQALMDAGRFQEAEVEATWLLEEDPDCLVTREKRILCRRKLSRLIDELSDRIYLLEKFEADSMKIHNAYLLRGSRYLRAKKLDLALADIKRAEAIGVTADALALRGKVAYEFGDHQTAVQALTSALNASAQERLFPRGSLLTDRSLALQKLGRYHLAYNDLTRALQLEKRPQPRAWLYWLRACVLMKLDKPVQAAEDVRKGRKVDPSNLHLAILHAKFTGEDMSPDTDAHLDLSTWQSNYSLVLTLYSKKQFDRALRELDKLASRHGHTLHTRFWRAQILMGCGQFEAADQLRAGLAKDALKEGKVLLWAWSTDIDWRCRLDDIWNG